MTVSLHSRRSLSGPLAVLAVLLCSLAGASAAQATPSDIITTVAGGGSGVTPATQARLGDPEGVAVDAAGDVFIADMSDDVIREVTPDGTITTVAGNGTAGYSGDNGPATQAELDQPRRVAVDARGDLFIADTGNNRIREVATDGTITTVAGTGTAGFSGDNGPATQAELNQPMSVAVDSHGNLFIADGFNNRIREVATDGTITTVAGGGLSSPGDGGAATSAALGTLWDVAVDLSGDLFIADGDQSVVREVAGATGSQYGQSMTAGDIYTLAGTPGTYSFSGDNGPGTLATLTQPTGVAVDPSGDVYIADNGNNVVREVTSNGTITTAAGQAGNPGNLMAPDGDNGPPTSATMYQPISVAVTENGDLYIADSIDSDVREVAPPPAIYLPQTTTPFGSVASGDTSATATVTVSNSGSADWASGLTIGQVSLNGTNPDQFSIVSGEDHCSDSMVPAGGSCTIGVQFDPTAQGGLSAELDIPSNDTSTPTASVALSGTGLPAPVVSLNRTSADFGSLPIGGSSAPVSFTVTNTGGADLTFGQATFAGANAGQFAIVSGRDGCSNNAVPAGTTCSVAVRFEPTALDAQSAELDLPSNDPNTPTATISLTGVADPAAPTGAGTTGGSPTQDTTPTLTATAQPGSTVTFIVDGTAVGTATADSSGHASFTLATPLFAGRHTVTATQTDAAGNTSAASAASTFTVTPPTTTTTTTTTPAQPAPSPQPIPAPQPKPSPTPTPQPTPTPKPVRRMTRVGHPKSTQQLLAHGEEVRVYCNEACSLKVNLKVYYRAEHRGARHEQLLHNAHAVQGPQDWWRVTVAQKLVALNHAGYRTVVLRVDRAHRTIVADAGGILLGVYTHHNGRLVRKRWLHVHDPEMPAKVRPSRHRRRLN